MVHIPKRRNQKKFIAEFLMIPPVSCRDQHGLCPLFMRFPEKIQDVFCTPADADSDDQARMILKDGTHPDKIAVLNGINVHSGTQKTHLHFPGRQAGAAHTADKYPSCLPQITADTQDLRLVDQAVSLVQQFLIDIQRHAGLSGHGQIFFHKGLFILIDKFPVAPVTAFLRKPGKRRLRHIEAFRHCPGRQLHVLLISDKKVCNAPFHRCKILIIGFYDRNDGFNIIFHPVSPSLPAFCFPIGNSTHAAHAPQYTSLSHVFNTSSLLRKYFLFFLKILLFYQKYRLIFGTFV